VHSFTISAPDGGKLEVGEVTDIRSNRYFMLNTSLETIITFNRAPGQLIKTVAPHQGWPGQGPQISAMRTQRTGHSEVD